MVGVGLLSIMIALLLPGTWAAPAAGFSYFLIGPTQWIVGTRMRRLAPARSGDLPESTRAPAPVP